MDHKKKTLFAHLVYNKNYYKAIDLRKYFLK